jgi:hypothetical protein
MRYWSIYLMYKYICEIEKSQLTRRKRQHLVMYQWWEQEDHVVMIYEQTTTSFLSFPKVWRSSGEKREYAKSLSTIKGSEKHSIV